MREHPENKNRHPILGHKSPRENMRMIKIVIRLIHTNAENEQKRN